MASSSLARGATWALPRLNPTLSYVVRVLTAALLALYAAYVLQLESPASAATTVLIVAGVTRGAILSKSLWRLVGTAVGAVMAVVLMVWFAQAPLLFILAFALWLGACTFTATLLRHFRAYAAVLAGYTITLIAFGPALAHPDRILDAALARGAAVTVGVLVAAVVNVVGQQTTDPAALIGRVTGLAAQVAALLGRVLAGEDNLIDERRRLALALDALDEAIEFGAAENWEIRQRAPALRTGVAWLFAALTGGCAALGTIRALADSPDPERRRFGLATAAALAPLLQGGAHAPAHAHAHAHAIETLEALTQQAEPAGDLPTLAALAVAAALAGELAEAAYCLETPRARGLPLRRWRNYRSALRNGARAAIAVTLAGLFWIETAWPAGSTMLVMLGPLTALLGTNDSAAAASVAFLKGTSLAIVAGFICVFGVLNEVSGFPLLAATLVVFLGPAVYATTRPKYAGIATAYLIFFTAIVSPGNRMSFDLAAFLNTASAFLAGAIAGVLAFRILLPPSAPRDVRLAARAIRGGVLRLARHPRIPNQLVWEHRLHQALLRLSSRLPADPAARHRELDGAIALILIGRLLLRARAALLHQPPPPALRQVVANALQAIHRPTRMRHSGIAERAATDLAAAGLPRVAASFHSIQMLLDRHAEFLDRQFPDAGMVA